MGFAGCIPRFLKTHAGWVLTALGSAGLVGTVILTAKETPEVEECIQEGEINSVEKWCKETGYDVYAMGVIEEFPDEAYLTTWEKIKIAFPIYLPAILMGAGTLACFWGSQIFNARKQTALIAAYGTLAMQFDQYREAIKAEYGEEADKKAFERSQKVIKALKLEIENMKKDNGPYLYTFASLPGVIFEAKPSQMFNAFMHYNHNAMNFDIADLNMLYEFAGLPEGSYDKEEAMQNGWKGYENCCTWGDMYIDFDMEEVVNRDGRTVFVIETYIPPYDVTLDYQEPGMDVISNLYKGYDPEKAKALAMQSSWNDVYVVSKDHTCRAVHPF